MHDEMKLASWMMRYHTRDSDINDDEIDEISSSKQRYISSGLVDDKISSTRRRDGHA